MCEMLMQEPDHAYYFMSRLCIPVYGGLRKVIMDEAHQSQYSINPGSDKMYHDLLVARNEMDVAEYVNKCLTCLKVKQNIRGHQEN
jgi:hypothetical protein